MRSIFRGLLQRRMPQSVPHGCEQMPLPSHPAHPQVTDGSDGSLEKFDYPSTDDQYLVRQYSCRIPEGHRRTQFVDAAYEYHPSDACPYLIAMWTSTAKPARRRASGTMRLAVRDLVGSYVHGDSHWPVLRPRLVAFWVGVSSRWRPGATADVGHGRRTVTLPAIPGALPLYPQMLWGERR